MRASNAGGYTVVITNPYGSVTSAVATLTVPAPAIITSSPQTRSSRGSSPFLGDRRRLGALWVFVVFAGTNLVQSGTNSTLTLPEFPRTMPAIIRWW